MYRCWMKDCGPDDGVDIDAADAQDAAGEACELWNSHGVWAGDPIPWTIEVYVRDSTGACYLVEVTPSYEVSFWGGTPRLVDPTET